MTDFFSSLTSIIGGVLRLDAVTFQNLLASPKNMELALATLVIAGVSLMLGQSVALFANRVDRVRFVLSLAASALMLIIGVFFWALSIWAVMQFVMGFGGSIRDTFIIVAAGHAPLIYGFLVLLPYLGRIIYVFLRVWMFVAVWVGVTAVYGMSPLFGMAAVLLGWLLLEILTHFLPILDSVQDRLWQLATGRRKMRSAQEVVDYYVQRARERIESAYEDSEGGGK